MYKETSKIPPNNLTSPNNNSCITNRCGSNVSGSLMNSNGQIMYRRSPSIHHSSLNQQQPQSYETVGTSPSASTSFNSEALGETVNSYQDEGHTDDWSHKFELLRLQVNVLTENQADQEEKYKRSRQENDVLLDKIHILEDQLRDLEYNSEIRAKEDDKRFKEAMAKQTKTQNESDQYLQSIYQLQQDICKLQSDIIKYESTVKVLRSDKEKLETELRSKDTELSEQDDEIHKLKLIIKDLQEEDNRKDTIINILNEELEDNSDRSQTKENTSRQQNTSNDHIISGRSPRQPRFCSSRRTSVTSSFEDDLFLKPDINSKAQKDIDGLEMSLNKLREENINLKSQNEELQAQVLNAQIEEGRFLVQEGNRSYSLADELGDVDVPKLMKALNEQQEDNARLRKYMDEILLKIVEKNPEILDKTVSKTVNLEVKTFQPSETKF